MQLGRVFLLFLYRLAPGRMYKRPANIIKPGRILVDVGGARGKLENLVADKFDFSLVVDVDAAHFPKGGSLAKVWFICASGCYLPFRVESVDSIVFHDSLHHLEKPERGIREALQVLRNGGSLYIFDFDGGGLAGRVFRVLEKALGFPAKFLTLQELVQLLKDTSITRLEKGPLSRLTIVAVKKPLGKAS